MTNFIYNLHYLWQNLKFIFWNTKFLRTDRLQEWSSQVKHINIYVFIWIHIYIVNFKIMITTKNKIILYYLLLIAHCWLPEPTYQSTQMNQPSPNLLGFSYQILTSNSNMSSNSNQCKIWWYHADFILW